MALLSITPDLPGLQIDEIENAEDLITIYAHANAASGACPLCSQSSVSVHSSYCRHPSDLPSSGKRVRLVVEVRRFFCANKDCCRTTFAERFPSLLEVRAQRTTRLDETLSVQARATNAEMGSRVVKQFGMPASGDTLLRILRRLPVPDQPTPRVLGVDDWAFRKGHNYGTILCDLERHCPVDLLPDRSADTFAAWLEAHPGVEVISRDRSAIYAEGATRGAPNAIQVVDRWHLLKNLGDTVQEALEQYRSCLLKGKVEILSTPPAPSSSAVKLSKSEKQRLANITQRRAVYDQIIELHQQGLPQPVIAKQVGVSARTVSRFVNAASFPERKRRSSDEGKIASFLPDLCRHFEAGCHNAREVWRKLRDAGFMGSYGTVYTVVHRLQRGLPATKPPRPNNAPLQQLYAPRQAKWIFTARSEKLKPEETVDLAVMLNNPDLSALYKLTQDFSDMVSQQRPEVFDNWLAQAETSIFPAFRRFVNGLRQDYTEVKVALSLPYSNGQVEGQVNRLKLKKREMYGRAKFDLLRQRVLQHI